MSFYLLHSDPISDKCSVKDGFTLVCSCCFGRDSLCCLVEALGRTHINDFGVTASVTIFWFSNGVTLSRRAVVTQNKGP